MVDEVSIMMESSSDRYQNLGPNSLPLGYIFNGEPRIQIQGLNWPSAAFSGNLVSESPSLVYIPAQWYGPEVAAEQPASQPTWTPDKAAICPNGPASHVGLAGQGHSPVHGNFQFPCSNGPTDRVASFSQGPAPAESSATQYAPHVHSQPYLENPEPSIEGSELNSSPFRPNPSITNENQRENAGCIIPRRKLNRSNNDRRARAPPQSSAKAAPSKNGLSVIHSTKNTPTFKTPQNVALKDNLVQERAYRDEDTGQVQGWITTYGRRQRTRGPFTPQARLDAARVRQTGACPRCREYKIKCSVRNSPYEPCHSCRNLKRTYKGIPKMPCFLAKICDIVFFRLRPSFQSPLDTGREQVYTLTDFSQPSSRMKELQFVQGVGVRLTVYAAEFAPDERDKTAYKWEDASGSHKMDMPPYCLANLERIKPNVCQYIEQSSFLYLRQLQHTNDIIWDHILMASRYAEKRRHSMVGQALNLWAISRMIEKSWSICSRETLGLKTIIDKGNPWKGSIPITPIMDTQLDQLIIKGHLIPLQDKLLNKLSQKINIHAPDMWFETYLTTFVLLVHEEELAAHSNRFARRYGIPRRFANMEDVERFFHTSNILLAHFHFVCNGSAPLRVNWRDPSLCQMAKLTTEEVGFMENIIAKIRDRAASLTALRSGNKYETPLFWCHQMFFPGWQPLPPIVEEVA